MQDLPRYGTGCDLQSRPHPIGPPSCAKTGVAIAAETTRTALRVLSSVIVFSLLLARE
jgi:hypothetical protein